MKESQQAMKSNNEEITLLPDGDDITKFPPTATQTQRFHA